MITVTKPFLPPVEEFEQYIRQIWDRNWLTNNGPLVNELELRLKQYLGVDHLLYTTNGTVALQIAIKALGLSGEIITTPFSYVATTASIVWEGCTPVFADIDRESLNIDPAAIEPLITERTVGILATHTYGNPCDIAAIDEIARRHGLPVIYDAAHCFGTRYRGQSVYAFGTVSTASFHATKLFHTGEGGALITNDASLLKKMAYMRNFGHNGPDDFAELGINGKNSEIHAALGLTNLRHMDEILERRREQYAMYEELMQYVDVKRIRLNPDGEYNYAYYPVIFSSEQACLKASEILVGHWIYPRRYFYPALNSLRYVTKTDLPVSDDIGKRVLCLPLYHQLTKEEIDFICRLLLRAQNNT